MKTVTILIIVSVFLCTISCNKDDDKQSVGSDNTITFVGQEVTFNSLSINEGPNFTTEYILTTDDGLSMVFYAKYLGNTVQNNSTGIVTYEADDINFQPVNNYPNLTVRGYINYDGNQYLTNSGQVKIKLNENGNQNIEFDNLELTAWNEQEFVSGEINLPKS